jgi:hypothetical protein
MTTTIDHSAREYGAAGDAAVVAVLVAGWVVLALKAWAFVDAWRWPARAYRDADRLRRWVWLWVLAAAAVLQLWQGLWRTGEDNTGRALGFMAGLVVLGVYAFDVRPRVARAAHQR